jgi:hypothetical protein
MLWIKNWFEKTKPGALKSRWWQYARLVLLLGAVTSHIWYLYDYGRINADETYQTGQSLSLLAGEGLTLPAVENPMDLSDINYFPAIRFPPGFPILEAPLIAMTGNPGTADFLLESLATLIFFVSWFAILELGGDYIGLWPRLVVWIYWIIIPAPLLAGEWTGHSTETLSVAFFSANLALCVLYLAKGSKAALFYCFLGGIMSGAAAALRYLYWPLVAVTPAALLLFYIWKRKSQRGLLTAVFLNAGISALFVLGLMFYEWTYTGHVFGAQTDLYGNISATRLPATVGIQWSHLSMMIPFPAFSLGIMDSSFFDYFANIVLRQPDILYTSGTVWVISGLVFFVFLASMAYVFQDILNQVQVEQRNTARDLTAFVTMAGLITVVLTVGMLGYLSVTSDLHKFGGGWTPVMTLRYYTPVFAFFLIGLALALFRPVYGGRHPFYLFISFISILVILAGLAVSVPWHLHVIYDQMLIRTRTMGASQKYENAVTLFELPLQQLGRNGLPIVVVYPAKQVYIRNTAMEAGLALSPWMEAVPPESGIATKKPVNIIFIYQQPTPASVDSYISGIASQYGGECYNRGGYDICYFVMIPDGSGQP